MVDTEPKKRGRKAKKINNEKITPASTKISDNGQNIPVKVPKKRGRKPKGGKIIEKKEDLLHDNQIKSNIILHLKCSLKDINEAIILNQEYFSLPIEKRTNLSYQIIQNSSPEPTTEVLSDNDGDIEIKHIWRKLKELEKNLHKNTISDKKSACFFCTCNFDNPPIYIPKYQLKESFFVYGCFCSPECAVAYLMQENIDSATRFERYQLLNYLYCKIYDYEKNIKPAPNPHYTLNKFYGNLTIQEYRKLLKNERLLLIVDKPLTRILPELYEDNDDLLCSNKPLSNLGKYVIRRQNSQKISKNNIVFENFGGKK